MPLDTPELIKNNYNGFLVQSFDKKEVSDRILSLSTSKEERDLIGENAKQTILNKFSIDKMINSYLNIYRGKNE